MDEVLALGASLSAPERLLVAEVAKLSLATHGQLASLVAPDASDAAPDSIARSARRTLQRLTDLRLLARLERRIGGVRAGSAGYVYYLGPVGQRLVAYWNGDGSTRGRVRPEPGERFVRHRLAVSQLYVDLRGLEREGDVRVVVFQAEPECWRPYTDHRGRQMMLKPDAFLRLTGPIGERQWMVEVDLGTESRTVIGRKLRRYADYLSRVRNGAGPGVLMLTQAPLRATTLQDQCAHLAKQIAQAFVVTTWQDGLNVVAGEHPG